MANQADKKTLKNKQKLEPLFQLALALLTLIKLVFLLIQLARGTLGKLDLFLFALYLVVNVYTYKQIINCLELGLDFNIYFDIFCVVNTFQIFSIYSNKIFYLLWAVR